MRLTANAKVTSAGLLSFDGTTRREKKKTAMPLCLETLRPTYKTTCVIKMDGNRRSASQELAWKTTLTSCLQLAILQGKQGHVQDVTKDKDRSLLSHCLTRMLLFRNPRRKGSCVYQRVSLSTIIHNNGCHTIGSASICRGFHQLLYTT